ncbi:hypothetical protein DENSPDRAFT_780029 [Dentipellis sp. KUC8613]|nr:hypothetical protein DENSPDRAFT_780029 [Dentipellis sp. KUC8613]
MIAATQGLNTLLEKSRKSQHSSRHAPDLYRDAQDCDQVYPGCADLCPAWFALGHSGRASDLRSSSSFKDPHAQKWLDDISESNGLVTAALKVIHPDLYLAGMAAMRKLSERSDLSNVVLRWSTVFSGVSIISNRQTLCHRDFNSRHEYFDILATIGPYGYTTLNLPGLNTKLSYTCRTIVAISGKAFEHEVPPCEADRICYAYWMRDSVHRALGIPTADWTNMRKVERGYDGCYYGA